MYNHRTGIYKPKQKRKKPFFLLPLIIFLSILGYFIFSRSESQNLAVEINSEESESAEVIKEPHIFEPINLPDIGYSALGTLDYGVTTTNSTSNTKRPMASITKIITALVVLEKVPLNPGEPGDVITLTALDEENYYRYIALDGIVSPVTAGLQMSTYDVLQAMLLMSANNMTDTLVNHYFSTHDEYFDAAREFLQKNNLNDTQVADFSGFSPQSFSTPSDLVKLGQLALNNPVVKEIVAKPKATIAVAGEIPNYNGLINDPNINGIKPGLTDEAGLCLLFSAEYPTKSGGTETVIGVIMGHDNYPTYFDASRSMLAQAKSLL